MTLAQQKLIKNYNSLRSKLKSDRVGTIISFCMYFQSDDPILYKEFEKIYPDYISAEALIKLYAKRYNLDPNKDIDKIRDIFLNNTIFEGFSYHLNSTANVSNIMQKGLCISAIGIKTEERNDYEMLQRLLPQETFQKLQPFRNEKQGSRLYYSNVPILSSDYGDRPEWLKELRKNSKISGVLKPGSPEEMLVKNLLDKYDEKYSHAKRVLFLIPNPHASILKEKLDQILQLLPPKEIISIFLNDILTKTNLYTTKHVEPNDIMVMNLESFDISCNINNITPQHLGQNARAK